VNERLLRDLVERARRAQEPCPPSDAIAWPDTTGFDPEAAILADAQALVAAGFAHWIDEEPPADRSERSMDSRTDFGLGSPGGAPRPPGTRGRP